MNKQRVSESATEINRYVLNSGLQRFPVIRNSLGKNTLVSCETLDSQSQQSVFPIMQHDS